jgi:hypothetical protein
MGLDIYLYRYDDFKKTQEIHDEYNRREKEIWEGNDVDGKYGLLTEEQKDNYRAQVKEMALSLGLDQWGDDKTGKEQIEMNSKLYPDHYFKIGYFRSSYNNAGIERILRNLGLPTMANIFDHQKEDYYFQPNWEESLTRLNDVIEKFKTSGAYRVESVHSNIFGESEIKSEKDALSAFMNEIKRDYEFNEKNPEREKYNYSNSVGEFSFNEPKKVLALIPGKYTILGERECVYVVTESDNTWYINALEIIKETIEYVLSLENREQYYLHWSG